MEGELAEITPVLESAKKAVGMIKSDNINEIRSLKMPPEPIHDVLSAVLMLLGINDTSWLSMKKFLGNRGVKDHNRHTMYRKGKKEATCRFGTFSFKDHNYPYIYVYYLLFTLPLAKPSPQESTKKAIGDVSSS